MKKLVAEFHARKLNEIIVYLNALANNIEDQDQKQLLAEAYSDIQTVRNKLNEN